MAPCRFSLSPSLRLLLSPSHLLPYSFHPSVAVELVFSQSLPPFPGLYSISSTFLSFTIKILLDITTKNPSFILVDHLYHPLLTFLSPLPLPVVVFLLPLSYRLLCSLLTATSSLSHPSAPESCPRRPLSRSFKLRIHPFLVPLHILPFPSLTTPSIHKILPLTSKWLH